MTDTPAAPPPPPAPPAARWPEWFHGLDVAAAAVAVAVAFLAASAAVRNSSVFLHLAGGRALVQGKLTPGRDPFTHAGAAGRPWADTHWLFDLAAYAVYSADVSGAALVAAKAVGVAVAVGLLVLLRASGRPLFPWVAAAVLTAVAVADTVPLASTSASMPLMAAALVLACRLDWTRPGWRNPLLLGGLFLIWANTDGWFVIGVLAMLAVWLGGRIDRRLGRAEAGAGRFGRGLLVAVAACLLNPFVLGAVVRSPAEAVSQLLPWEFGLTLPSAIQDDIQFGVGLTLRPTSDAILTRIGNGDDLNTPALAVLAVLSLAGASLARSATAGLLTLLGLAVGLTSLRLVPVSAVLLVPSIGWGFNRLAGRVPVGRAGDPGTRILVTLSGLGRFLTLLAGLGVGVVALPGRLHPPRTDPAYGPLFTQRVEWMLEPDPALKRTAEAVRDWPADRKGMAVGPDLANYAAWFAPGVRQFVTTRYAFHRDDLPDLVAMRTATLGRKGERAVEPADLDELGAAMDRQGGGYLVVTPGPNRLDGSVPRVIEQGFVGRQTPAVFALGLGEGWTLWHLDGRAAVLGKGKGGPAFDPAAQAFREGERLPAGPVVPPPPEPSRDPIDQAVAQVLNPIKPPPVEVDDALTLCAYLNVVRQQAEFDARRAAGEALRQTGPARGAVAGGMFTTYAPRPVRSPTDAELAVPVLAVRAARRAVVATPDRPEPYRALFEAYMLPLTPASVGLYSPAAGLLGGAPEAESQQLTAAARLVARLPVATAGLELREAGIEAAKGLAREYFRTEQLDLARDAVKVVDTLLARRVSNGKDETATERKQLEAHDEELSAQIQKRQDAVRREQNPARLVPGLVQAGLPGKALDLFRSTPPEQFGRDYPGLALFVLNVQLRAGRLEAAAADLAAFDELVREHPETLQLLGTPEVPNPSADAVLRPFVSLVARLAGDPRTTVAGAPPAAAPLPPERTRQLRAEVAAVDGLAAVSGWPAALVYGSQPDARLRRLMGAVQVEVAQQNDRGLLALVDADPTEAGRRFEAALTPLGQPLTEFDPPLADRLSRYRALLRKYGGK